MMVEKGHGNQQLVQKLWALILFHKPETGSTLEMA